MKVRFRKIGLGAVATAAVAALTLTACSPGSPDTGFESGTPSPDASGETTGETGGEQTTVSFRLWDDGAAAAYEKSFAAFTEANPDIKVDVELVPWADYWTRLPQDIGTKTMADIFWTNTSNFGIYADQGRLIDISEVIGTDHDEWNQSVVDLYTRDGKLWGVPQLSDSIALFYNKDLVDAAGVDVNSLKWSPNSADDTFLPALEKLTTDGVYGFNAQNDLQAIWIDWLAQNGATFQTGDEYSFDSPEGVEAFQYLVDLINKYKVAPPAADTNADGNASRDMFVQGKLALFQSGQYSLTPMLDIDGFEWGIAPMVEGPKGRIGVVHGVAALGNADSKNLDATVTVLKWLGSAEGQKELGATGAAFPAAIDAQSAFTDFWTAKGVDTSQFATQAAGKTVPAPLGPRSNAGLDALLSVFPEMFEGRIPVAEALQQAQQAGNEAIKD